MFPAPREVDREIYMLRFQFTDPVPTEFPAPREGDREIYRTMDSFTKKLSTKFPAPLEVDRYLLHEFFAEVSSNEDETGFRPLSR